MCWATSATRKLHLDVHDLVRTQRDHIQKSNRGVHASALTCINTVESSVVKEYGLTCCICMCGFDDNADNSEEALDTSTLAPATDSSTITCSETGSITVIKESAKSTSDDPAKRLPCGHVFHMECLSGWFQKNNTCPLCRWELPTDNPVYEAWKRKEGQTNTKYEISDMAPETKLW